MNTINVLIVSDISWIITKQLREREDIIACDVGLHQFPGAHMSP